MVIEFNCRLYLFFSFTINSSYTLNFRPFSQKAFSTFNTTSCLAVFHHVETCIVVNVSNVAHCIQIYTQFCGHLKVMLSGLTFLKSCLKRCSLVLLFQVSDSSMCSLNISTRLYSSICVVCCLLCCKIWSTHG